MPATSETTATSRPLAWIERLWSSIADRGRAYADVPAISAPPQERARSLAAALLSGRGEASGAALARELLNVLKALPPADRLEFCRHVATNFAPDATRLHDAATAYLAGPTAETAAALADAAEPPRQELLRRINQGQGGTAALVALRREILAARRANPDLAPLDDDLRHLFASWFNRGFLELRRIDWNTPAAVLEKLIAYEAVHEIDGWSDLRRRLGPDRRCFAFFHPALPGDPLIFVEVALVTGLAEAVQPLLAPDTDEAAQRARAAAADTAIFYSISNCQKGLAGVTFGNFLIKQVVEDLAREIPSLKTFVTLSPVPGFATWLDRERRSDAPQGLTREDVEALRLIDEPDWHADKATCEAVRKAMIPAAAAYFLRAKNERGRPLDPVARFHLGNGARLERINWLADTSDKAIAQACGLMVNYLYDLDDIEKNHEAFAEGRTVVASNNVQRLLRPPLELVPIAG